MRAGRVGEKERAVVRQPSTTVITGGNNVAGKTFVLAVCQTSM